MSEEEQTEAIEDVEQCCTLCDATVDTVSLIQHPVSKKWLCTTCARIVVDSGARIEANHKATNDRANRMRRTIIGAHLTATLLRTDPKLLIDPARMVADAVKFCDKAMAFFLPPPQKPNGVKVH